MSAYPNRHKIVLFEFNGIRLLGWQPQRHRVAHTVPFLLEYSEVDKGATCREIPNLYSTNMGAAPSVCTACHPMNFHFCPILAATNRSCHSVHLCYRLCNIRILHIIYLFIVVITSSCIESCALRSDVQRTTLRYLCDSCSSQRRRLVHKLSVSPYLPTPFKCSPRDLNYYPIPSNQ
jgi:hypothetical protein